QEGPDEAGEGRAPKLEGKTPITLSMHGLVEEPQSCPAEEEGGTPIPTSGLLQVAERRQPLSSVSSLEVHFDLLDLTELTDMSDQELAEVFADSDEENVAREPTAGKSPLPPSGPLKDGNQCTAPQFRQLGEPHDLEQGSPTFWTSGTTKLIILDPRDH
uniref:Dysbindin domain-containing protein 1 n=1 Tax=Laticauda laticaudata TaxID=8630 RepID=A0A8C5WTL8_LATLA